MPACRDQDNDLVSLPDTLTSSDLSSITWQSPKASQGYCIWLNFGSIFSWFISLLPLSFKVNKTRVYYLNTICVNHLRLSLMTKNIFLCIKYKIVSINSISMKTYRSVEVGFNNPSYLASCLLDRVNMKRLKKMHTSKNEARILASAIIIRDEWLPRTLKR